MEKKKEREREREREEDSTLKTKIIFFVNLIF
jgi:hypothetical protein